MKERDTAGWIGPPDGKACAAFGDVFGWRKVAARVRRVRCGLADALVGKGLG